MPRVHVHVYTLVMVTSFLLSLSGECRICFLLVFVLYQSYDCCPCSSSRVNGCSEEEEEDDEIPRDDGVVRETGEKEEVLMIELMMMMMMMVMMMMMKTKTLLSATSKILAQKYFGENFSVFSSHRVQYEVAISFAVIKKRISIAWSYMQLHLDSFLLLVTPRLKSLLPAKFTFPDCVEN